MWVVIKFDKKKFGLFKEDLFKKLGKEIVIYRPKMIIQKLSKNKMNNKEIDLLGDYLFCFHEDFLKSSHIHKLKFIRGSKYILDGFHEFQEDIKKFIEKCKSLENEKGFISQTFYETYINSSYKFSNGPFAERIFKVISLQKNKIEILMGNIKTRINKQEFL